VIDPTDFSQVTASQWNIEEALLFWCVVAGKSASQMSVKLDAFLANLCDRYKEKTPFDAVRAAIRDRRLHIELRRVKMGKYTLLGQCFRAVIELDPYTCSLEELEDIPGIGPKTARCFLLHSRPGARVAGLDTHVLKWLRAWGNDVPLSTPQSRRAYLRIEEMFLQKCDEFGMEPSDLDLRVWMHYSGRQPALHLLP
jgi:thermostable 8-oxoguanine DNA glycosylase